MDGSVMDETELRIDLAAAFRLAARADWHEGVATARGFDAAVAVVQRVRCRIRIVTQHIYSHVAKLSLGIR